MQNTKEMKGLRVMELFMKAIKGESLSVQALADEYHVSTRSITRDINMLKDFLAENRDAVGYAELKYSGSNHCYTLQMDSFFSNKELLAIAKVLIGCRTFNTKELLELTAKLKRNTSPADRPKLEHLIQKEMYHYTETGADCESVMDNLWKITEAIEARKLITISYYRMDRAYRKYKIKPVCIMFSEYYFYLIAYVQEDDVSDTPRYFRMDRITQFVMHREQYSLAKNQIFDEGLLRKWSMYFWPGPRRQIRFEFTGPSVQAVLDKIPTARIIEKHEGKYVLEAEVYGDGIKMFLLSQGAWIKVIAPESFVCEMREEITKMLELYQSPVDFHYNNL